MPILLQKRDPDVGEGCWNWIGHDSERVTFLVSLFTKYKATLYSSGHYLFMLATLLLFDVLDPNLGTFSIPHIENLLLA